MSSFFNIIYRMETNGVGAQFQPGYNLSLSPTMKIWACVIFMYTCLGEIGSLLVIISTLNQRINASTLVLLSLSIADWIYTTQSLIITIGNLLAGQWAFGKGATKVIFFIELICILCSGTSVVLLTLERYFAIFHKKALTKKVAVNLVIITWSISVMVSLIPIMSGSFEDSISISTAKLFCSFNYTSHRPVVLAIVFSVLCFLGIYIEIMIFVYYKIVSFYLEQRGSKTRKLSNRERELIKKAVIICLTFVICWIPISCSIIYSEITMKPVGPNSDAVTFLLMVTNSVINPYLLIMLDARIKQNVFILLNIPFNVNSF